MGQRRWPTRQPRSIDQIRKIVGVGCAVLVALGLIAWGTMRTPTDHKDLVIGKYTPSTSTTPTVTVPPPNLGGTTIPAPRPRQGGTPLLSANGQRYGKAIPFVSNIPDKDGLVFFLVVGSDARPGQNLRKTRTDSLHVVAIDPATKSGTVVGIPRDTYINIPGRGNHRINEALSLGGPQLMMQTVREFTGLPVEYYVITAFEGFANIVDELGGVDVYVPRTMDDDYSGAHFEQGYHHFDGPQALAFCRDRHDVPYGDFSRSLNQGSLILAALGKLRSEVGDGDGLRRWLTVLLNHAELDVPASELEPLAALGRRVAPSALNNVVMPGKTGTTSGGASVVYPTEAAHAMWADLRDDARLGGYTPDTSADDTPDTTDTTVEDTTTTSEPTPTTYPPIIGGGNETTTTTSEF
ncbi:MAG: polyisoprenyl-teichoic acid--peptidoglycan teichoic acid transferase [Actinomycetota bacterium]